MLVMLLQVWYAVAPGKDRKRFEELAKGLFPKDAAKCANFLRHKTIMITPQMLKKHGISYVKVKLARQLSIMKPRTALYHW